MEKFMKKKRSGQTIVEYILIVVLVAIASLVVLGLFSDTLRKKISGAISSMTSGTEASDAQTDVSTKSEDILKGLDEQGAVN
jgi:Flp pilus assembly pilin Flp